MKCRPCFPAKVNIFLGEKCEGREPRVWLRQWGTIVFCYISNTSSFTQTVGSLQVELAYRWQEEGDLKEVLERSSLVTHIYFRTGKHFFSKINCRQNCKNNADFLVAFTNLFTQMTDDLKFFAKMFKNFKKLIVKKIEKSTSITSPPINIVI